MRRIFAGVACRLRFSDVISPLPSPVCGIFALICWLYLIDVITHSFTFFFIILTCWAIQVQVLLQVRSFDFPAPVSRLFANQFLLVFTSDHCQPDLYPRRQPYQPIQAQIRRRRLHPGHSNIRVLHLDSGPFADLSPLRGREQSLGSMRKDHLLDRRCR